MSSYIRISHVMMCIHVHFTYSTEQQPERHPPDIMWCREPFMEELNEIEALNDIGK